MKKTLLFVLGFISLLVASTNAQQAPGRNCGTVHHLEMLKAADPSIAINMRQIEQQTAAFVANQLNSPNAATVTTVTIPVVFHVVYKTAAENITDAKCIAQLNQLNLDYARLNTDAGNTPAAFAGLAADTKIQFCLAQRDANGNATTGIIHKSTTSTSFIDDDKVKSSTTGGDNAWPASSYLNIWTCNLGASLLGYAQFPGGPAATDGVVLLYSSVGSMTSPGTAAPYDLGRTATHEVGHWLNLIHIWGDASCGTDLVTDTPTQLQDNSGCPTFPHKTCGNTTNGDMYMNYMDYTNDACMNMFSTGQSTRMNALFTAGGARVSLLTSLGCQPPSASCGLATGLAASAITTTTATLGWTAVSGAVSYNVQYRIVGSGTWTSTTSATNSKAVTGLTAASNYEFQVQSVCAAASSAFTASATFTTASAACGTATGLAASAITTTTATLGWTAVSGAVSYNVQYRIVGSGTWTSTTSATNSKAVTGLTAASNYEFQVQTVCAASSSAFTASSLFTTSSGTGCTDAYESNNTSATAKPITANTGITALIDNVNDVDWFSFSTMAPNTNVKVALSGLPADYDVTLYNAALTQLGSSQNTGVTAEQIINNTATAGSYLVKVHGFNSAALAGYNFTAGTAAASSNAAKMTVSSLVQGNNNGTTTLVTSTSASSGYTGASGTYNAGAAARTGALNTAAAGSAYFEFTVTPTAGSAVTLTGISFGTRSTSTGPQAYALRSSLDGYATTLATGTIANTSAWALKSNTGLTVAGAAGAAVTFRIYGYNGTGAASAGTANWRVDDIAVTGSVNAFSASQCYTLTVSTGATAFRMLQPFASSNDISLYPNPVKDYLNLQYRAAKDASALLQVTDQLGRVVIKQTNRLIAGNNKLSVNTQSLRSGVYFIRVTVGGEVSVKKFVVE